MYQEQITQIKQGMQTIVKPKYEKLRKLDLFVLDNTIRETTVGQLRGHTMDNKWQIYDQVKKCGFKHMIVASFSHMTRLGDTFIKELHKKGEDMTLKYAFTEFLEKIDKNRVPIVEEIPVGLRKMKELGIPNCIIEMDLVYGGIDYTKFNAKKMCDALLSRFRWVRKNMSKDANIFVNLRDMPTAFKTKPKRVFKIVNFISSLAPEDRIFGIVYEESGKYLAEELGVWTRAVRDEMDKCGWKEGHLLVHTHEQWGMQDAVQIECLANGSNGIWAGLSIEGASMGHASSTVTLMNLVRMGNNKVLKNFNCTELRKAAIAVTKIVTGHDSYELQPVYGARALDMVFGMDHFPPTNEKYFNMAKFFGQEPVMRMTTLASPAMIVARLTNLFGQDPQFTEERAKRMLAVMLEDLHANRKEEYMSAVGLAVLFDRSGGHLTEQMSETVANSKITDVHIQELIAEVRKMWDQWDLKDGIKDETLEFDAFYNGFMAPYFGCYRCDETKLALKCIDMDEDGTVDWNEFALYLRWAGRQYPKTKDAEELLSTAFRKGLIPAMQDEVVKTKRPAQETPVDGDLDYGPDGDDEDKDFLGE